ncbi:MAG: glycosyltransferase [Rhodothermales bacterium]
MKILLVHNRYQQRGGEDLVYEAEGALLESRGHEVIRCEFSNDEINAYSALQKFALAGRTVWSGKSYRALARLVKQERPDVAHFHNTLPLISPSGYYAVRRQGCAVVQTLHNYRLTCLNGLLLRNNRPCEDCVGKTVLWPGVRHACYRDSRATSGAVAAMLALHRTLNTYHRVVDRYIALTPFARSKFLEAGLPTDKIVVKPNFLQDDPGPRHSPGDFALFVGRIAPEKGIDTLLKAWQRFSPPLPLKIVGQGPLTPSSPSEDDPTVDWLGPRSRREVLALMKKAAFLVFPSICYEGLPMTIVEAYACSLPVIASRRGSMIDLVEAGRTGLHFDPQNADDLAATVRWWLDHPEAHRPMQHAARASYEHQFTAERNYQALMDIYRAARAHRTLRQDSGAA